MKNMKIVTEAEVAALYATTSACSDGGEFAIVGAQILVECHGFDMGNKNVYVVTQHGAKHPEQHDVDGLSRSDFTFEFAYQFDDASHAVSFYGSLIVEGTLERMKGGF